MSLCVVGAGVGICEACGYVFMGRGSIDIIASPAPPAIVIMFRQEVGPDVPYGWNNRLTEREIQRPDSLSPDVLVALQKLIDTNLARSARGPAETGKRVTHPGRVLPPPQRACRRRMAARSGVLRGNNRTRPRLRRSTGKPDCRCHRRDPEEIRQAPQGLPRTTQVHAARRNQTPGRFRARAAELGDRPERAEGVRTSGARDDSGKRQEVGRAT